MNKNGEDLHKIKEPKKTFLKIKFDKNINEVEALVWTFGISSIVMVL